MSQGTPNPSVNKAVPNAVVSSTNNSVPVLTAPVLGPYQPMKGSAIIPVVPTSETSEAPPQPHFTGGLGQSAPGQLTGSMGAPSVPTDGFLFRAQPIDQHYMVTEETKNPYSKVNNPKTVGWWTRIQEFANHTAINQNTTNTGFKISGPQQRTSVMRNQLPPVGIFGDHWYKPAQQPQAVRYNRIRPSTGSDPYGSGVLNNDTLGAGQTAGGVGGSNYTPAPGPPDTNAINTQSAAAEPTWG